MFWPFCPLSNRFRSSMWLSSSLKLFTLRLLRILSSLADLGRTRQPLCTNHVCSLSHHFNTFLCSVWHIISGNPFKLNSEVCQGPRVSSITLITHISCVVSWAMSLASRLQGTAPFSHPKPKKKPRYPYRNRKKPAGF